jgi:hypothetical protein
MRENRSDTVLDGHLTDLGFNGLTARRARLQVLWRMTPTQRVAAMRRGKLSLEQCAAWAARYPEQVPLTNGEYEFLAAFTPDVYELPENVAKRAKSKRPSSKRAT